MSPIHEREKLDIKEALNKGNYEGIIDYAKQSCILLNAAWNDGNKKKINAILQKSNVVFRRFMHWIKSQDMKTQAAYDVGRWHGSIQFLEQVLYTREQEESISTAHQEKYRYIKHLKEIVDTLYTNGPQSHTDLARLLQMNASTLSEAMKKIMPEDLISMSSSGKYKVYTLTDDGRRYARKNVKDEELNEPNISDNTPQPIPVQLLESELNSNSLSEFTSVSAKNTISEGDMINLWIENQNDSTESKLKIKSIETSLCNSSEKNVHAEEKYTQPLNIYANQIA